MSKGWLEKLIKVIGTGTDAEVTDSNNNLQGHKL